MEDASLQPTVSVELSLRTGYRGWGTPEFLTSFRCELRRFVVWFISQYLRRLSAVKASIPHLLLTFQVRQADPNLLS